MSNLVFDNIKKRRSVRKFQDKHILDEELNLILEAGTYAPSALNQQSSLIVVLKDKKIYQEICELTDKYFPNRKPYFYGLLYLVIVIVNAQSKMVH